MCSRGKPVSAQNPLQKHEIRTCAQTYTQMDCPCRSDDAYERSSDDANAHAEDASVATQFAGKYVSLSATYATTTGKNARGRRRETALVQRRKRLVSEERRCTSREKHWYFVRGKAQSNQGKPQSGKYWWFSPVHVCDKRCG